MQRESLLCPGACDMNFGCRSAVLLTMVVLGTWPLLAGTKIVHRWVLTGLPMPQFKRILVAGVMENYLVRQDFEDEMKTQLPKYGVDGVSSIDFLPPKNEMMEGEAKQRIKESTLDGVLVVRPKEARQETEEVGTGGVYMPPPGYYSFWPYWNMAYGNFISTSSYTQENIIVRVEFNLYYVKDEKLVWSGEHHTQYPKYVDNTGGDFDARGASQEARNGEGDATQRDSVVGKRLGRL